MTAPITEEDLARWEAIERAATAGPWGWESVGRESSEWCLGTMDPPCDGQVIEPYNEETGEFRDLPMVVDFVAEGGKQGTFADATFITTARSAFPRLIAEVRRLHAQVEARAKNASELAACCREYQALLEVANTRADAAERARDEAVRGSAPTRREYAAPVARFAEAMLRKLRANDHKAHWREEGLDALFEGLDGEIYELRRAVDLGLTEEVLDEAADVANFAMFIADWMRVLGGGGK